MDSHKNPLYQKDEAEFMRERETPWRKDNKVKFSLLLEHIGSYKRLVDIGCGWGQFLCIAQEQVSEVWGVDESPARIEDCKQACSKTNLVMCGQMT